MKASELQKMIKIAVKEAIKEELKDIIYEAVTKKSTSSINENTTPEPSFGVPKPTSSPEMRNQYMNMMGGNETFTSQNAIPQAQGFQPTGGGSSDAQMGIGDVSMDQIMGLMSGK